MQELLDHVKELEPKLKAWANEAEKLRQAPPEMVAELRKRGFFRFFVPESLGGTVTDLQSIFKVYEALGKIDGSIAWLIMITTTTNLVNAYLPIEHQKEVFGDSPDQNLSGVLAPTGHAVEEGEGYRVSGRWSFASGCHAASWMILSCTVFDGDKPRMTDRGTPDFRMMAMSADQVQILDTWDTLGLCGTGSHDIEVKDLYIPKERSMSWLTDRPCEPDLLFHFPVNNLLSAGISVIGLGIARGALDTFYDIAVTKVPAFSRAKLGDRQLTQYHLALAETKLESARRELYGTINEAWEIAERDEDLTFKLRARCRAAATNAALVSAEVVDMAFNMAGGSSIYKRNLLQRSFRDIHTMTAHVGVKPETFMLAGRAFMGLDKENPNF